MPQAPIHLQGDTLVQGDTIVLRGTLRYVDGAGNGPRAAGQVLTADTAGNATWQANPARQLGVPVFLDLPLGVGGGTGGQDWTTYSPPLDSVPGNVSALIVEAQGRMDAPNAGNIDSFIFFRKNNDGQQYAILAGRSSGLFDSVGWAGQGLVPMQPGAAGQPGSFQYTVSGPGFNYGWSIRIVGYFP